MGTIKFAEKNQQRWNNHAYVLPYKATTEFDMQSYMQTGDKLSLLTSDRLVQVTQLRPIDKLYTVLLGIRDANKGIPDLYGDFLDFVDQFTLPETCAMLIQIISD